MQTGWVHANGYDYYLGTDGVVQTGIQHIDGKIYYFGVLYNQDLHMLMGNRIILMLLMNQKWLDEARV